MQTGRVGVSVDQYEFAVVLPRFGLASLLQLDDDVRRFAGLRMLSGEYDIGSFGGQRQVVLEQYFNLLETGLQEVLGEDGQASFPGSDLGGCGASACVVAHLLGESHS